MVWGNLFLLAVTWTAEGFNIYQKPARTFSDGNDGLFGQTVVQSQDGVLVPAPNSNTLLSCTLNARGCMKRKDADSVDVEGRKPIVSVSNQFTGKSEKTMICQQRQKEQSMNFNGKCTILSGPDRLAEVMRPGAMMADQMRRLNSNNNNNNNNGGDDEDEKDETSTEIGFVLDGSGSISVADFLTAKKFIITVMSDIWDKCFNCDFAVVQYGSEVRSELLLKESIKNGSRAIEKVKNIQQINGTTVTATAIQYLLNYSFTLENGSKPDAKKIMIVISDGSISLWDKKPHFEDSLRMLDERGTIRYAIGVGEIKTKETARVEMLKIAGNVKNQFLVDDYNALNQILSELKTSIISGIEGLNQVDGFKFQLAEAGFSAHLSPDGSLLFGAVGANDWSGGVILKHPRQQNLTFLQAESQKQRFSYLGYSVLSAQGPTELYYISGAPRHNLTGGVFVFDAASHKQRQLLQGEQAGSYFGSVLCALDINKNGVVDYLLVGAPSFYERGEDGRVYVYKLEQGMFQKVDFEWQGLERYEFARFGSAIASVGDLDGNMFNDVAVGAPLETDDLSGGSGSIYIYNAVQGGLQRRFSQRISSADFDMKLRHFGQSVSAFSNQMDKHRQLYIGVGSEGTVTILETLPIIGFEPRVTLSPKNIPLSWQMNQNIMPVTLKICLNTQRGNINESEELIIPYNIDLDVGENMKRLDFKNKVDKEGHLTLQSDKDCLHTIQLSFAGCQDCFSPIVVRLTFSLNTSTADKPLRILDALTPNVVSGEISFENDCAVKGTCVGNISLADSRLSHHVVVIGSSKSTAISFNLTNGGDGAFRTMLVLTYPNFLQYSQATLNSQNSTLEGLSCENEIQESFSRLKCLLLYPVFRSGAETRFTIHWQIMDRKSDMVDAEIHANLTCANRGTQVLDTKTYNFGIKNALKVQLQGEASPNIVKIIDAVKTDISFTFKLLGENIYGATLRVKIGIRIPAHHTFMEINAVEPEDKCKMPLDTVVPTKGEYVINCTVVDLQDIKVLAHASVSDVEGSSSGITASANVEFDDQYQLLNINMKSAKVFVVIVKQEVVKSKPAIIAGSIGGFLVLALFIVILFKCGFFKKRDQTAQ